MAIIPYQGAVPKIGAECFIAPDAWITGKVELADRVALFFGVVMRGDIQRIIVGAESNFQEHAVVHTSRGLKDCVVGKRVTVGHRAILHGCVVEDSCIIGMGSTILDNARIGRYCIVGANALITMNSVFAEGQLILGSPAKAVRALTQAERASIESSADSYLAVSKEYRQYFATAGV